MVFKSRRMKGAQHIASMRQMQNAYRTLIGKLEGKRPFKNLDIDGRIILEQILKEIGNKFVDWIHLAQNRDQWQALVNAVMNLWVP
jgi:hypothetical protein